MNEKRFAVTQTVLGSGIYDFQAEDTLCESYDEDAYGEVCKKLNKLHDENNELKGFFKELEKSGYWNEKFLIEQDWADLKSWINIIMERLDD